MAQEAIQVKDRGATAKRLWGYLRYQKVSLIAAVSLIVMTAGLQIVGPYLMGRAIDDYIIPRDMGGLARILLLMGGLYLVSSVLTYFQARLMANVALKTVHRLRSDIFDKLQKLPLRFFDSRPHGDTMSRVTNDVETINQILTEGASQMVSSVLMGVGVMIMMIVLQPVMGGVAILSLVLFTFAINRFIAPRTREGFRHQQREVGKINGIIEETITGQRTVKAYVQEENRIAEFTRTNLELREHSIRAQTFAGIVGPVMNFTTNFTVAMVAASGGWLAVTGRTSIGVVATMLSYSRQLSQPISQISQMYTQLQSALAGAERIFEILDEDDEIDAEAHAVSDARHTAIREGDVVFRDVDFSYDGEHPVLRNVNLHAAPGSLTALVGPTGAGKSTIINLLTRFYEIDSGEILIDGVNLQEINKSELRQQLGIVLQDGFLFAGSVMENIRYGRLDATDEEVIAAAESAQADEFVRHLPEGYDTVLTERGGNVSQGQRQLLTIARALLANPRILILDEATSNVDTRTEKLIQKAMARLMEGRTSFVIAHRLSTIRGADQILVINKGEIIERGTHAELVEQGGFYAALSSGQYGGDADLLDHEQTEALAQRASD